MGFTSRTETQYAIRLRQHDGSYRYQTRTEDGTRNPRPSVPLTEEKAKRQLELYTKTAEPTVVTRQVTVIEGPWGELDS